MTSSALSNEMAAIFLSLILGLIVVFFCSVSVLLVLIPQVGKGKFKKKLDQQKQRAFYIIVAMFFALLMRFATTVIWIVLIESGRSNGCVISSCVSFLTLPSSLVLPLLFLHKVGKL